MTTHPTDAPQFIERVHALPERYGSRLRGDDLDGVREAFAAGEWGYGLEELVASLTLAKTAVTLDEQGELRTLFETAGLDATAVDDLMTT